MKKFQVTITVILLPSVCCYMTPFQLLGEHSQVRGFQSSYQKSMCCVIGKRLIFMKAPNIVLIIIITNKYICAQAIQF